MFYIESLVEDHQRGQITLRDSKLEDAFVMFIRALRKSILIMRRLDKALGVSIKYIDNFEMLLNARRS